MAVRIPKKPAADTYLACVMAFPLKAIKSDRQHDQAVSVLTRLGIRGKLDHGELEYVEALVKLIADFESHAPDRLKSATGDPIDVLKFLMTEGRMSVSALGTILGSQGVASEILARKRDLSKSHIRKLAGHFHVDPGLFL
jgi:antitoxin component HigA of HigAB toxin-antitoxin module